MATRGTRYAEPERSDSPEKRHIRFVHKHGKSQDPAIDTRKLDSFSENALEVWGKVKAVHWFRIRCIDIVQ